MKAKDYANKFIVAENKNDTLVEIAKEFLGEIEALAKARNAKLNSALIPICKELNQKWCKFAYIVNKKYSESDPIKYTGFKEVLKHASPEIYSLWLNK